MPAKKDTAKEHLLPRLILFLLLLAVAAGTAIELHAMEERAVKQENSIEILRSASETVTWGKNSGVRDAVIQLRKIEQKKAAARAEASKKGKIVYLTYDDGPGSVVTPKLLNVLKKYHAKATFFLIGKSASQNEAIIRREIAEGHAVGVHTWSHNYNKIYKNPTAFFADFSRAEKVIERVTGEKPRYCRMPGGSNNSFVSKKNAKRILNKLHDRGYACFDWNCATNDATGVNYSTKQMVRMAIRQINANEHPVVLIHDSDAKGRTPAVTEKILKHYANKNMAFASLDAWTGDEVLFLS